MSVKARGVASRRRWRLASRLFDSENGASLKENISEGETPDSNRMLPSIVWPTPICLQLESVPTLMNH